MLQNTECSHGNNNHGYQTIRNNGLQRRTSQKYRYHVRAGLTSLTRIRSTCVRGGGGGFPIMDYTERFRHPNLVPRVSPLPVPILLLGIGRGETLGTNLVPPNWDTFFRLAVFKRVGISRVEIRSHNP